MRHFLLLVLFGCGPDVSLAHVARDSDHDGFDADVDCDDTHASVNPDAEEVCDGVDDDCDGVVDDGASDQLPWHPDADGDGAGDGDVSVLACDAPDGYVADGTDCDDANSGAFPGNEESCDGVDDDCDGDVDEAGAAGELDWYADEDGDSYGDASAAATACSPPTGFVSDDTDCDDTASAVHPDADESDCTDPVDYNCDGSVGYADLDADGSVACEDCDDENAARSPTLVEVCDASDVDEDCDSLADEDDPSVTGTSDWFRDADGDAYGTTTAVTRCDAPTGYASAGGDCDDTDAGVNPGAVEACDAADTDEDCDGLADDADPSVDPSGWTSWYADGDGDGYGDASAGVVQCDGPAAFVADAGDCDDADAGRNPGEAEVCDGSGTDEDCDGLADDDDPSVSGGTTWYADTDGDGYGDPSAVTTACAQPSGYVPDSGDCDDGDAVSNPGATEVCDTAGVDEDCDGLVDDADPSLSGQPTWYRDADGDGYAADGAVSRASCAQPPGYAPDTGDCDDLDTAVNPAATEVCDASDVDEDCDGAADDADADVNPSTWTTFYRDHDADGYGDARTVTQCDAPASYVTSGGDCDDTSATVSPAGTEVCDGADVDEDCDGLADDDDPSVTGQSTRYVDADEDGYGNSAASPSCDLGAGYSAVTGDCDDASASVRPGATEVCDGANVDEDCDGLADDHDASVDTSTYTTGYGDDDGDGYGEDGDELAACDLPSRYVAADGDCDDADTAIHPGAAEICDAGDTDEDCDGLTDDADPDVVASGRATGYGDDDGDGYGDVADTRTACDLPADYLATYGDCDDEDAAIHPGATEICDDDDDDDDCDGLADDDDPGVDTSTWSTGYRDDDGDLYGELADVRSACDLPAGYVAASGDCDDANDAINPGAAEICDADDTDEDCDGLADDDDPGVTASTRATGYADEDGDGFGDAPQSACDLPATSVAVDGDCDDADAAIHPGATEICDATDTDQDCDGLADDADTDVAASGYTTGYADADGDGYGDTARSACDLPATYVTVNGDCDDTDDAINPDAAEICDAADADEDCDGLADDADASVDASGYATGYLDDDGDGYGDDDNVATECDLDTSYVASAGDCDDTDDAINPAADEHCDDVDEDCDGQVDEDAVDGTTAYADADGDGYGDASTTVECDGVANADDCDDDDDDVYPGATERCDGIQDDCDATSWSALDEVDGASFTTTAGVTTDLTSSFLSGTASSPTSVTISSDGTLEICPGTYYVRLRVNASDVSILGGGSSTTTLDAGNLSSGLALVRNNVTLYAEGFELTDGGDCYAGLVAGNITCSRSTGASGTWYSGHAVTLVDVIISDSEGQFGGGIKMENTLANPGTLDMYDSLVTTSGNGYGNMFNYTTITCSGSSSVIAGFTDQVTGAYLYPGSTLLSDECDWSGNTISVYTASTVGRYHYGDDASFYCTSSSCL